jgi:hypothetical protein
MLILKAAITAIGSCCTLKMKKHGNKVDHNDDDCSFKLYLDGV